MRSRHYTTRTLKLVILYPTHFLNVFPFFPFVLVFSPYYCIRVLHFAFVSRVLYFLLMLLLLLLALVLLLLLKFLYIAK